MRMIDRSYGINLIPCSGLPTIIIQVRTHPRRRINKKWRKKYGYRAISDGKVYRIGNLLYAHPDTIKRLGKKWRNKHELFY